MFINFNLGVNTLVATGIFRTAFADIKTRVYHGGEDFGHEEFSRKSIYFVIK